MQILNLVVAHREKIIEETGANDVGNLTDDEEAKTNSALKLKGPSSEALSKMTDYREAQILYALVHRSKMHQLFHISPMNRLMRQPRTLS